MSELLYIKVNHNERECDTDATSKYCVLLIVCSAIYISMKSTCILLFALGACLATDSSIREHVRQYQRLLDSIESNCVSEHF